MAAGLRVRKFHIKAEGLYSQRARTSIKIADHYRVCPHQILMRGLAVKSEASHLTISNPESRRGEGNMISSAEGFQILGNWKMQKTPLWLAVSDIDELQGPEVRIVEVSREPAGVVFDLGGGGELEPLDLKEAEFDKAESNAAPFPNTVTKRFGFFLNLSLADGRTYLLAQRVQ